MRGTRRGKLFSQKNWRQRQFSEVAKRHSRFPGDICLRQIRPTRLCRVVTPFQNLWGMGKLLSIARRFRGIFPLTDKKTPHLSSASKVFEDSKETFCKKFLWRGPGQRPVFASPPTNPNWNIINTPAKRKTEGSGRIFRFFCLTKCKASYIIEPILTKC